ncbi:aldose epimerase family protein [Brucella sp. 2280]|uniref:aldose epimerase family protein n=1 Tax=Brucella sp. 2280 TaxID=2592625 RepID=UPI0012980049|nr:aldose epimerase family protein [Brucella sp. 2280]QGA55657.1 galactose-1-epimerase [Brucella sp. 2280]
MNSEIFGYAPDGQVVHRLTISNGPLTAKIINWGAAIQDLRMEGHPAPLVIGYRDFADYPAHSPHLGAIAGRSANRIRNARFDLDGTVYEVEPNFLGRHNLHGGSKGLGHHVWKITATGPDFVSLATVSPDGEMGFPGNLNVNCTYMLNADGTLIVRLEAVTDRPTICNLLHHSYFNLDDGGDGDVLDHQFKIAGDAYLPVDEALIPDGRVLPVKDTVFDFREFRSLRMQENGRQVEYDNNFCLAAARGPLRPCASVKAARSGIRLDISTTEPGIQLYAGNTMANDCIGLTGKPYGKHAGFCLEPQIWPGALEYPYFPQPILRPGDIYAQTSHFTFSREED